MLGLTLSIMKLLLRAVSLNKIKNRIKMHSINFKNSADAINKNINYFSFSFLND